MKELLTCEPWPKFGVDPLKSTDDFDESFLKRCGISLDDLIRRSQNEIEEVLIEGESPTRQTNLEEKDTNGHKSQSNRSTPENTSSQNQSNLCISEEASNENQSNLCDSEQEKTSNLSMPKLENSENESNQIAYETTDHTLSTFEQDNRSKENVSQPKQENTSSANESKTDQENTMPENASVVERQKKITKTRKTLEPPDTLQYVRRTTRQQRSILQAPQVKQVKPEPEYVVKNRKMWNDFEHGIIAYPVCVNMPNFDKLPKYDEWDDESKCPIRYDYYAVQRTEGTLKLVQLNAARTQLECSKIVLKTRKNMRMLVSCNVLPHVAEEAIEKFVVRLEEEGRCRDKQSILACMCKWLVLQHRPRWEKWAVAVMSSDTVYLSGEQHNQFAAHRIG